MLGAGGKFPKKTWEPYATMVGVQGKLAHLSCLNKTKGNNKQGAVVPGRKESSRQGWVESGERGPLQLNWEGSKERGSKNRENPWREKRAPQSGKRGWEFLAKEKFEGAALHQERSDQKKKVCYHQPPDR